MDEMRESEVRLAGKVSIITGGARGIGASTAMRFAEEGANVLIADILEEKGKLLEKEINDIYPKSCHFLRVDVSSSSDWQHAIDVVISRFGRLDVLVNNAAIFDTPKTVEELSEEVWDKIQSVNAKGVFLGTKSSIPLMRASGGGSIVNVSSQFGLVGASFENPAYQASKGAIRIFTKATALQYAKDNIRANSVHPGPIDTEGSTFRKESSDRKNFVLSRVPMGRAGKPEEVAAGILFLASDESSFITGSELVIDGGYTAQ
jgi:NAD(P)-dependent dehydrogenase (short-subunit alcohol dehydrogenase family)